LPDENNESEKEQIRGREIMRLLHVYRGNAPDGLIDAALDGREKSSESVIKLYGFVLNHFGFDSKVTTTFWRICCEFLRNNTELTSAELGKIHSPFPRPGDRDWQCILDEMRERKS
jgi:hypothetical protein